MAGAAASRTLAALALVAACASGLGAAARAGEDTGAAMREIFDQLRYLLPLSVRGEWREPRRAGRVRDALQAVAGHASLLAGHARDERHDFRFLGQTLAADLRDVLRRYQREEFESAGFLLLRATDYCVACHVRLPAQRDSPLSEDFVDDTVLAGLPLQQRARLELATRRFDDALASFEALFAAPGERLPLLPGALTDYLIVSLRVRQDPDRAQATLAKLAVRADLSPDLRGDVGDWLETLRGLPSARSGPPSLALAIELLEQAARRQRYVADRRSLIHYVLASAVVHRVVESRPERQDLAHAYYLLGLAELRIGRDFWIAQGEMFLETSIRLAPESPVAAEAYALLEEETLLNYTGSSGLHLPEDQRQRLEDLRSLVDPH